VSLNGSDPGQTADQAEATLAVSWAGAAAPGAQIVLVPTATTSATDGLDLSLATIVDQALAHTVAVGYSACEHHSARHIRPFMPRSIGRLPLRALRSLLPRATAAPRPAMWRAAIRRSARAMALTLWPPRPGIQPWRGRFGVSGPAAGVSAMAAWSPANPADPDYAGGGGGSTLYSAPSWQPAPAQPVAAPAGATYSGCCRTWPCRQQSIPA